MIARRAWLAASALLSLAACAVERSAPTVAIAPPPHPIEVQILAINDFHGALQPPKISVEAGTADAPLKVPAGGVAHLATAAKTLRAGQKHSITVSAGDLIGATPLASALFLDEPAIETMEEVGLDYNAVGNHEFDKGSAELLRMQRGGCEKHTNKAPCRVERFDGADFQFLAANVLTADGRTLLPGTALKDFGPVQVGIIGMTLKETATLVSPGGVAGLRFADEAATANAAIPALKAAGADAIMLLIHQGAGETGRHYGRDCASLTGDIFPILERLDPAVDLVVSGHTHASYICELPRPGSTPRLLTSAARSGTMITDIRLRFSADARLESQRAENIIVQGEGYEAGATVVSKVAALPSFAADPAARAIVDRYVAAAAPEAARPVGRLDGPATKAANRHREQTAGNLIADAQLAAGRRHGAQIAFMNSEGVRTDLVPARDGSVTYGQIFSMQPFGNTLVVKTLTGAQLKALLEQQFASGTNTAERPNMLLPSSGFFFAYDLARPAGDRIVAMRLGGKPVQPGGRYRVVVNNFMASGGDNFTVLAQGGDPADAGLDLDALEAWLKRGAKVPALGRIENRTAR
jgi:5'-nucleotidase